MVSANRDTCRMDLCKAWITKICSLFMGFPYSSGIATHCICRKIEYVTIATATKHYRVPEIAFQFAGYKVAGYYTSCLAVYQYQFLHFMAGIHFYITQCYLAFQCLVCTY